MTFPISILCMLCLFSTFSREVGALQIAIFIIIIIIIIIKSIVAGKRSALATLCIISHCQTSVSNTVQNFPLSDISQQHCAEFPTVRHQSATLCRISHCQTSVSKLGSVPVIQNAAGVSRGADCKRHKQAAQNKVKVKRITKQPCTPCPDSTVSYPARLVLTLQFLTLHALT